MFFLNLILSSNAPMHLVSIQIFETYPKFILQKLNHLYRHLIHLHVDLI